MGSVGQDSGSRLSALRDFSAGLKNLRRRAEDFSNPSASSFAEEYTPAVRQVAVEPVEMPALPELSAGESLPSRRVITAPQILPPKIAGERADSPRTGTSTRRDRRRSVDNVEILPSRRGQYKKK